MDGTMTLKRTSRGILSLLALTALFACQGKPPAVPAGAQEESSKEKDRHELVLQPKEAGKPGTVPLKLTIQLISEKSNLSLGDKYRYRLEIRNVGREPVAFRESAPSFIKDGSLCAPADFSLLVTPPGGAERAVPCEPASAPAAAGSALDLTLQSGEYLLTRPEGPSSRFRELRTPFHFDRPGTYRLKTVYAAAGLRAESNTVAVDVVKRKKIVPLHVAVSTQPASAPAH